MRILVADDDRALSSLLARSLEVDGHEVIIADDGEMAIAQSRANVPELALLDLNLPRREGTEVLEYLRSLTEDLPILILTAREEPDIRLRCLEMGADDFMQKPFSLAELRARCRALLRRRASGLILRYGDLEINRVERTVRRKSEPISLTNKEFALLEYLMLHRGCAVSRATLLEKVWNMNPEAGTNVVDVYINYLRRKLRDSPSAEGEGTGTDLAARRSEPIIRTVRGTGYTVGIPAGSQA